MKIKVEDERSKSYTMEIFSLIEARDGARITSKRLSSRYQFYPLRRSSPSSTPSLLPAAHLFCLQGGRFAFQASLSSPEAR